MEAIEIILGLMSIPGSRRGSRILGIKIPRGVQHLEDANLSPLKAMELRYSFSKINVLCAAMLIVESTNRELMSISVAVIVSIWL